MDEYLQYTFTVANAEQKEILIALLFDIGFEGFEEDRNQLNAFIPATGFDEEAFNACIFSDTITYTRSIIEPKNWNEVWEKDFEPVIVENFCAIRANFHNPITTVNHEIIITPKMSFGTGHHATTYMMILAMQKLDFKNKTVFDFGTGTGVLAILAEKMGARLVEAIDIDEWSIINAKENIEQNKCTNINLNKEDQIKTNNKFDIILANINKNIILQNMEDIVRIANSSAQILFSGLLVSDKEEILAAIKPYNFKNINTLERNSWLQLSLSV